MARKPKLEADKQQQRDLMIDAARELFIAQGVEAVTMRAIAQRIGYSATAIYLHFADKDAVLRAVCDADFLKLASLMKDILAIPDPLERLIVMGQSYAKFALTYPNHYRLMFMTPHAPCSPEVSNLEQNNPEQDGYFQLKSIVDSMMQANLFKPHLNDVELLTQVIWASMHGVCALEITMGQDTWVNWRNVETRLTAMQKIMLDGLLRDGLRK